ncbi:MAG TPA: erythromycin esterase family protein [Noviherbaspirillum sp.]|nr:erythromycin esterase family protein [Noviherbaspirillum sp.]
MDEQALVGSIAARAVPLSGALDVDAVLKDIGDARIVLLGEATHGTHEFYRCRAEISKRLIAEREFDAIAIEGDWPDALQIDREVRQHADHDDSLLAARQALTAFHRFPQWMWRNREMLELCAWLHRHNRERKNPQQRAGVYGLDLYSLRRSMEAVVAYLSRVDPAAAREARARYGCFDQVADDPQRYGYRASFGMNEDCEDEVVQQLLAMRARDHSDVQGDEEAFFAERNAAVAQNAEAYYRAMFHGRNHSWNLRDTHMAETLQALAEHIEKRKGRPAGLIVWAHNSHVGDARATEMGEEGQLTLGQLVRERFSAKCYLLGFTTHAGTVCAASDWGGRFEHKAVRQSRRDSFENLFHRCAPEDFFLSLRGWKQAGQPSLGRRLERAIGVIYLPEHERASHYFHADITAQFDGVIHLDTTRAVTPLDPEGIPAPGPADTFPTGE